MTRTSSAGAAIHFTVTLTIRSSSSRQTEEFISKKLSQLVHSQVELASWSKGKMYE